jgi:hypothetical protein
MSEALGRDIPLLDAVLARYKADGFEVFVHPSDAVLPPFLKGCRPDAVAIGPHKRIAIEIARSNAPSEKISRMEEIFTKHNDWEFVVLYISPSSSTETLKTSSRSAIKAAAKQVVQLRDGGHDAAALVIGWSALEAIARVLLADRLARPQPPEHLVEILASDGYLTPDEADSLRSAAAARNAVAHGQLDAQIDPAQLDALISAVRTLVAPLPKNAA